MPDPLSDLHHYSPTLTIAQVIKFCDKKSLPISRPMIQNYIRDGLLPPPINRKYTHKHLAALVIICKLKTVYDIPEIKDALAPYIDEEGLPLDIYKGLVKALNETLDRWVEHVAPGIASEPEPMQNLLIMGHGADIKNLLKG